MHDPLFKSKRRLLLKSGVAGAIAAAAPAGAHAQSDAPGRSVEHASEGAAARRSSAISPLMRTVSTYIAQAATTPLPEAATEATKHHLLDTLAAMVSGTRLLPGQRAIAYVKTLGGVREACVPGTRIVTNVVNAAMTGGMLAHADETDDQHALSVLHPGAGMVPAALAMAEREKAGGTALLRAVALGYDIGVRVALSLGGAEFTAAGRDTHGFGCTFGAAAAAASLARFNADQVRHLLSYAAQQASGVSNIAQDLEHIQKAFQYGGMPGRNGVAAATVVATGWTGVDDVFAGDKNFFFAYGTAKADPETLARGLGETYEIVKSNIKRWPVGGPIQAPLDSLSYLMKTHKLKADDIEKVVVRVSHQGADQVNNRSMPTINMQQMVAVMLLDGTVTQDSANDVKRMQDPKVIELRRRVELYGDDEMDRVRPVRQAIVEIKLRDGRELSHRTTEVRGMAQNPMSRDEVAEKCLGLCAPVLGSKHARELIEAVWTIERVNNVRALRALLQS